MKEIRLSNEHIIFRFQLILDLCKPELCKRKLLGKNIKKIFWIFFINFWFDQQFNRTYACLFSPSHSSIKMHIHARNHQRDGKMFFVLTFERRWFIATKIEIASEFLIRFGWNPNKCHILYPYPSLVLETNISWQYMWVLHEIFELLVSCFVSL